MSHDNKESGDEGRKHVRAIAYKIVLDVLFDVDGTANPVRRAGDGQSK
jgi:hypothetical protein